MRNRMNMGISLIGRFALIGTVFLTIAAVHGAALKSTATAVEAGTELALEGTGFHADQTVTLVLLGALNEYTLRDVTVDAEGAFTLGIAVPRDVRPGQYLLLAMSGEELDVREAVMDLAVMAASEVVATAESHDEAGGHNEAMDNEAMDSGATAEEMTIARATSGAGWLVIGLLIGLAGGAGVTLLRGTPAVEA